MTIQTNYLLTVTEAKTYLSQTGSIANSNLCLIKDTTGGYAGPGAINNFYVDTAAIPLSTYTNNRYPRYQDLISACPTCTYATSIGTTTSCSAGTATQNVSINSSCGNSEARLSANGNGAVTTGWLNVSLGTAIYSFTSVPIGTYRVEVRPKSTTTTCTSQFSSNFNVCCNTSPTWVNTGSQYCDGCAIKQLQTDTNFCSSTYNTTQVITISASDASCAVVS